MTKRIAVASIVCLVALAAPLPAQQPDEPAPPDSIEELERRVGEILAEHDTPGVGIAIVSRDEPLWVAGVGKADVARDLDVTPDTMFRIGSTSKGFVSLAILRLVEQGRLSLDDPVRGIVPEIEFENRWERTDPVRVVHLLEHTTGWDDIHLAEYAWNDPRPASLREGLDFHPDSRVSRWRPGTRSSYCNSGPAVAAHIVEKLTGQRFEDHVEEHFFEPLGMPNATYFDNADYERLGATLYGADGVTVKPYWHISVRPSGAINVSAREMANYVRMYLGRGALDGVRVVSEASLARMERAGSTQAAREGLEAGYGLGNYTSFEDGFVFQGHNGGVDGGLTEMSYLPQHGLGYAFMINSGSGGAFRALSDLIRGYLTWNLEQPEPPPAATVPPAIAATYAGTYVPISPRPEMSRFFLRLFGARRLTIDEERLTLTPLLAGAGREYVAVTERLARRRDGSITRLALLQGLEGGPHIEAGSETWKRVPAALLWGQLGLAAASLLTMVTAPLFALVWIPRRLFGKLKGAPHLSARVWPLLAVILFFLFLLVFGLAFGDPIPRLGRITVHSVGQYVLGIAFAAAAVWSLVAVFRARRAEINRAAWWHSAAVACSAGVVGGYLLYWGMIGLRTWAY